MLVRQYNSWTPLPKMQNEAVMLLKLICLCDVSALWMRTVVGRSISAPWPPRMRHTDPPQQGQYPSTLVCQNDINSTHKISFNFQNIVQHLNMSCNFQHMVQLFKIYHATKEGCIFVQYFESCMIF